MEKNLGFFEAWRAKRQEKKKEESEKPSGLKVDTGVLSRYLKMRNPEVAAVEKVEGLNGLIAEETTAAASSNEKENEVASPTNAMSNDAEAKVDKPAVVNRNPVQDGTAKTSYKTVSQDVRRTSAITTPASSRKSSMDCSSRRGSIASGLSSFSNIQERILTLSQEQNESAPKKPVKVHKLSEDALKIGKQPTKDKEEPSKTLPKISSNLQYKLTKLGASASGIICGKSSDDSSSGQNTAIKKKITVAKSSTATKVSESQSSEIKAEETAKTVGSEVVETGTKSVLTEKKLSGVAEGEVKDSNSISVIKTITQEHTVKTESEKIPGKLASVGTDPKDEMELKPAIEAAKHEIDAVQSQKAVLKDSVKGRKNVGKDEPHQEINKTAAKPSAAAEVKNDIIKIKKTVEGDVAKAINAVEIKNEVMKVKNTGEGDAAKSTDVAEVKSEVVKVKKTVDGDAERPSYVSEIKNELLKGKKTVEVEAAKATNAVEIKNEVVKVKKTVDGDTKKLSTVAETKNEIKTVEGDVGKLASAADNKNDSIKLKTAQGDVEKSSASAEGKSETAKVDSSGVVTTKVKTVKKVKKKKTEGDVKSEAEITKPLIEEKLEASTGKSDSKKEQTRQVGDILKKKLEDPVTEVTFSHPKVESVVDVKCNLGAEAVKSEVKIKTSKTRVDASGKGSSELDVLQKEGKRVEGGEPKQEASREKKKINAVVESGMEKPQPKTEKIVAVEGTPKPDPQKETPSICVKPKEETNKKEKTNVLSPERSKPVKNEILRRELIEEAVKFHEGMTMLTNRANEISLELPKTMPQNNEEDKSETSCISQGSGSESLSFRKDPKKLEKKLKAKSNPNECYPKTQKLLTGKPVNAFEQAKLEESRTESTVSPTKVEAFLRDTVSPPPLSGEKEPVKTLETVVSEISTSKSEKSKHEKPSNVRYTSRGEVICGVVSIKPSGKEEETDLSAITLVPAFRPEKSIFGKDTTDFLKPQAPVDLGNPKKVQDLGEIEETPKYEEPEGSLRDCFSPVSDFSDDSYDHYVASVDYSLDSSYSRRHSLRSSSTPRRIFPQIARPASFHLDRTKEESPVVFDAGLSFDISSNRTSLRHRFKPQPAFTDTQTSSSSLSLRINDFLRRTDHIMDEWKLLGKGGEDLQSLVQLPPGSFPGRSGFGSRSATNIMIKGLLNYSKGSRSPSVRSRSLARTSEASDRTISDIDELSEMTLDLSEERATGTMQAERLEAETAERVRLEQELSQVQSEKKNLQQTSERLEMELFYARADVNGLSESEADLEDGGGDAALYKNKCERAMRELEFTRRRLQQQHEDDLEQLVALKKQLEKKLADAYEEVEEQRQVAAQWKRKVQKLQSETNDLRLLLEEQSSRNNLLEKKQRKFDSEIQMLQEELRSERNQKERLSREKEMVVAEKYSLEQNLSSVRLELELKEEKVSALAREVDELSRGGGTEQEVTQLRKSKHDLDMKLKEQEEELDELAGQVSMLEGNKLRLEMSLESLRKEHRREMAQRDDELDEVRANAQKKIKVLESQLESEHEERTLLVREKHELERRLADAEERGRHHRAADEDALQRARRDLKKTKALLRDAQVMLERAKQDSPSKAALRALKNQLEDAELARASAVKAKQSLETELNEVTGQLEEALRAKGDSENRCQAAVREINSLRTQVDENEEELAELLKKYRQTVQQLSAEQLANQETAGALAEAEAERASLRDQLAELTARLEANAVVDPISGLAQKKLEIRIKELESRLELEQTTRGRLEVQITRLKENVERLNEECVQARTKEQTATDLTRKLQRSLREAKEELAVQQAKEQEAAHKRKELEKRLEAAEVETATAKTDLRLAVKRIEDLQSAISGEIGSDSERSESDEEDSENDSLVSHVPSTISTTSRTSRTPDLTPR